MRSCGVTTVPPKGDQYRPPLVTILAAEGPQRSVESDDHGRKESGTRAVIPIDPPELIRKVEQAEGDALEEGGTARATLVDVAQTRTQIGVDLAKSVVEVAV